MGVNSLPKTVTRQRRDCDLNPGPSAPESCTLTSRLPSHQRNVYVIIVSQGRTPTTVWRRRHSRGRTATDRGRSGLPAVAGPRRRGRRGRSAASGRRAMWTRAASSRGSCRTCARSRRRATDWCRCPSTRTSTPTRARTRPTSSPTARLALTDRY